MTAHTVILAQTRVGFLTGGRKESFRALPQEGQLIQLEEAYGRATVALTRARSLCVIMGPLDMKGLVGAATVVGSLMYGAGHVFRGVANVHLHDKLMQDSPSDSEFARELSINCVLDAPDFPPPAIAEALEDFVDNRFKIRRLHLMIIVDTWRPWRYNADQIRAVTDQMWHLDDSPDCQRVVPMRPGVGGSSMDMPLTTLNSHVIWCGPSEITGDTYSLIPTRRTTWHLRQRPTSGPSGSSTSMLPLRWTPMSA